MLKAINKKMVLAAAVAGLVTVGMANANAAVSGAYVGGQLGYGNVHQGDFSNSTFPTATAITSNSSSNGGLAGRVYGGYQFNPNFAAELGYTRFHNATANQDANNAASTFNASSTIKTDAFDLVGKGILPLQNGFSVYGKLGVAYLRASGSQDNTTKTGATTTTTSQSLDANKLYPTFGAGVSYDITSNLSADVSWNHIQKVGSNNNLANTDFVGAGLAYNFG